MTQPSDTPTSQSAATRWTFYRRLGLLLRTRLDTDGTTLSLHDLAARTHGRVSADQLIALLTHETEAQPDPVICVLLAQAFDVDPDFFVTDEAVVEYITGIQRQFVGLSGMDYQQPATLQMQAYLLQTHVSESVAAR